MARGIQAGDRAPDFTLPAQSGEPVRLHDRLGQRVVDQGGKVRKRYGVPAVLGLLPGRVTYVIDRQGAVRHVFSSMTSIGQHVSDALEIVRQLQAEQPAQ